MRITAGLMATLILASAWAAGPAKPDRGVKFDREMEIRLMELESRARQLYPRRRDTPLRYLNITDGEVREVEVIARKYKMPELVNISPVVTGCPCEEGGGCTEQLYITSRVDDRTASLLLSRKQNLWTVGVVQKWWLEYAALQARETSMSRTDFLQARANLLLSLPMCAQPANAGTVATQVAEATPKK